MVQKLHNVDQTQNEFCIETKQQLKKDNFEEFLRLTNFEPRRFEGS